MNTLASLEKEYNSKQSTLENLRPRLTRSEPMMYSKYHILLHDLEELRGKIKKIREKDAHKTRVNNSIYTNSTDNSSNSTAGPANGYTTNSTNASNPSNIYANFGGNRRQITKRRRSSNNRSKRRGISRTYRKRR